MSGFNNPAYSPLNILSEDAGATYVGTSESITLQQKIDNTDGELSRFDRANARSTNTAIISFIFDDGYDSAFSDVAPLFESKNMRCGFAINQYLQAAAGGKCSIRQLLEIQAAGHEICNHSATHYNLSTAGISAALVDDEINGARRQMLESGFNVTTFVAANSVVHPDYYDYLKQSHTSAYTVYKGADYGVNALQNSNLDCYGMHRTNLYSVGLVNAKATVDAAIANNGYVCFYDHDPLGVGYANSMGMADLEALLDYIISVGARVVLPREATDLISRNSIHGLKTENVLSAETMQGATNLLKCPTFESLNSNLSASVEVQRAHDWNFVNNSATGGISGGVAKYNSDLRNAITVTMDTSHTASIGNITLQTSDLISCIVQSSKLNTMTLAFDLSSGTASVNGLYDVSIGIRCIRASDGVVVGDAVESAKLHLSSQTRRYHVTFTPDYNAGEFYIRAFVRFKPLTTGDAAAFTVANPCLNYGAKPIFYEIPAHYDFYSRLPTPKFIQFTATAVSPTTWTRLAAAAGTYTDYDLAATGLFTIRHAGLYAITSHVKSSSTLAAGTRHIIACNVNGTQTAHNEQYSVVADVLDNRTTHYVRLARNDTVAIDLWHAGAGSINIDTGIYSYVNIARVA